MASSSHPPSSDQLAKLLASNPEREAVDTLRGYDWQRWLTIEMWLSLTGEEALWIEWGEDFTVATEGEARTIQAKDLSSGISLGHAKIRKLISEALIRDSRVRTIIWTRALPSTEQGNPFGEPGINYWRKVITGKKPANKLKDFLLASNRLSSAAAQLISATPKQQLRQLLSKLHWVTGEDSIAGLKERSLPIIEKRLTQLGIPNSSIVRKVAAATLFETIANVSIRNDRSQRRVTRIDLDELLLHRNLQELAAFAPMVQAAAANQSQLTLSSVAKNIAAIPEQTALLIKENLGQLVPLGQPVPGAFPATMPATHALQTALAEAHQQDLELRYRRAVQRSRFPELEKIDECLLLAKELLEGGFAEISSALRRKIILRATRSTALRGNVAEAKYLLSAARVLEGPDSEVPAAARLAAAQGDTDNAIRMLRDAHDAEARSTLLSILAQKKGDDTALSWLAINSLTAADLTANGLLTLCDIYLRNSDFEALARTVIQVTDAQCFEEPFLLFFSGIVRFSLIFAKPDRQKALSGLWMLPLDVRFTLPVLTDSELSTELDAAIDYLHRVHSLLGELELPASRQITEIYLRWCELLHPGRKQTALARLRKDMTEPKSALSQVPFAFAYDPEFDPTYLNNYLEKREVLGGLDDDELRAALVLRLHGTDPRAVANFIGKYRNRLEASFSPSAIRSTEIQALAQAKEVTSARLMLDEHKDLIPAELIALLNAEIAKAEGCDAVAEYEKVYEKTKSVEALRALVSALVIKNDRLGIARYAEKLYALTCDPQDLVMAARALALLGDDGNFLRVIQAHPLIEQRDPTLAHQHAWALFRLGHIIEAKRLTERLHESCPAMRDLDLEIAIAVESGEWETLGAILSAYLESAKYQSGLGLIRAAQLAQTSGHGPTMDLIHAAVEKSQEDPNVLIGAYMLLVELGLEEKKSEAQTWFNQALIRSDTDGPLRRFELKELLSQQIEWREHTRNINEAIIRGDLPLLVAAQGLSTTLVELVLRNFVRNTMLADLRKRIAIPLFHGRHGPSNLSGVRGIALDVSALLTLGWLELLPKVISTYSEIVIPSGLFCELFESRRHIRKFQKSRLEKAKQLIDAIAQNRIKVKAFTGMRDVLDENAGTELATLIRSAIAENGIVVRPAPVHRPGALDEEADLSAYKYCVADMRALLTVLADQGCVDQTTEEIACRYFEVQDKGWPMPAVPEIGRPLFLDGLAVTYLQTVGLLAAVLDIFPLVYVDASTAEEASFLMEHEEQNNVVLRIIEEIRDAVRHGAKAGKVSFGPRTSQSDEVEGCMNSSSLHLLGNLKNIDIVVFDDRAINKEPFAEDKQRHRARVVTSLDVIDDLLAQHVITEKERCGLRHRLRMVGATLMPLDSTELTVAALRNRQNQSREFRSIFESIDLTRIAKLPRFPAEIPWFLSLSMAVNASLMSIWMQERDLAKAATLSNEVLDLYARPEDWIEGWDDHPPPDWIEVVTRIMMARLAFPIEIESKDIVNAYNDWLEQKLLIPMRELRPSSYKNLVNQLKSFIAMTSDNDVNELTPDLLSIKARLALSKLSATLTSDVLADGSIAEKFKLKLTRPVNLSAEIVLRQDELFTAFQHAADGGFMPNLRNIRGNPIKANVSIDSDGAALVTIGIQRWRFEYAVLLSSSRERRISEMSRILEEHSLTFRDREYLIELVSGQLFSYDDFFTVVTILASSPESFANRFRSKLETLQIGKSDLLPEDIRYWEHLSAPLTQAYSLAEFIEKELATEWKTRLSQNPKQAFNAITLTFSSPALVPRSLFQSIEPGAMIDILETACGFDDPFGLAGAFQICADRLDQDPQFAELGNRLLDRLFGDMVRLKTACQIFATAFIISTATLAEHELLRRYPPFWRRLAAASHASLVVRSSGVTEAKQDELVPWAISISGEPYVISVFSDFSQEPNWRPEWILDRYMVADVYGRVSGTVNTLPQERVPESWKARIEAAKAWVRKHHLEILAYFPAVLEGERRCPNASLVEIDTLNDFYRKFEDEPSLDKFLMLSVATFTLGFPPEACGYALKVILDLRMQQNSFDDPKVQHTLSLAAHIAAQSRDLVLADAIAETCMERILLSKNHQSVAEAVFRLVECAAANPDHAAARLVLAQRLEYLAFALATSELLAALVGLLETIKQVDPEMAPLLGRAIAAARLGRNRSVVM